jgi:transposase
MKRLRRTFDANVKLEVARMVRDQGMSVAEVSRSMSVGRTAVQRWVRQLDAERQGEPLRGAMPLTAEMQRIRQLEEENRRLRSDNDVLKKATAFFARELK